MAEVQSLSLPSEGSFDSFESLFSACQLHARNAGYALVRSRRSRKRSGRFIKFVDCKRSGIACSRIPDDSIRKRRRNTVKTDCKFSLKAQEHADGTWSLIHRDHEHCVHNHAASAPSAFHEHRQISPVTTDRVLDMMSASVRPKQIAVILRDENPSICVSHRDLYNIRSKASRTSWQGLSSSQALVANLEADQANGEIFFRYRLDPSCHLTIVYFAVCCAVQYAQRHHEVLLLDCTYKTNKFDMPLLHCMAVDHYGQSFTVALCFLNRETQENYDQAIQWLIETVYTRDGLRIWPSVIVTDCELALTNVIDIRFPAPHSRRILCRWHIMKNLTARFKAKFETEDRWKEFETAISNIISAKSTDEYLDTIQEIKTEFQSGENLLLQTPNTNNENATPRNDARIVENMAVLYVLGQWFGPHKEHIVSAWVDRQFTLGTTTTSRIEGGHRQLKDWIGGSSSGLQSVISSCRVGILSQLNEILISVEAKQSSTPLSLTANIYSHCLGMISQNALYKLRAQLEIIKNEAPLIQSGSVSTTCTGLFNASYGILCWHQLKFRIENSIAITPRDFHPFWHIYRPVWGNELETPPPQILDPISSSRRRAEAAVRRAQIRDNTRAQVAATGRILSQFEQVQNRLPHCSLCTEHGHNRQLCRGCQSTGHNRSNCPQRARIMYSG